VITPDKPVTLAGLTRLKVERPINAGAFWVGVNHGTLVTGLIAALARKGWKWNDKMWLPRFSLSRGDQDMAGAVFLGPKRGDLWPCVGVVASNARRIALRFYSGVVEEATDTVLVTDSIGGDDQIGRPHWRYTPKFDLEAVCEEAASWWCSAVKESLALVPVLKGYQVKQPEVVRIMTAAAEDGLLPWSRAGQAIRFWENITPTGGGNMWSVFRAFSQSNGLALPVKQMDRALKFTHLFGVYNKEARTA
jgi:hypothetical protein